MPGKAGIAGLSAPPAAAVFGATGFLGRNILAGLRAGNPASIGVARRPGDGMLYLDLAEPDIGRLGLKERGITHAVIAAGVSRIAECERKPDSTRVINVEGTVALAQHLRRMGIRVAVLSSDYVFDGRSGDYDEGSPVNPVNEYGRQKAEMEKRLLNEVGADILVIRLSKVFDMTRGSGTLLDEMAGRLVHGLPVYAAADQLFCPIFVGDVVAAIGRLLTSGHTGILHLCTPVKRNRLQVASQVAAAFACDSGMVREISLRDLEEGFPRPLDTSMSCRRFQTLWPFQFRSLESCIEELKCWYGIGAR